MLGYDVDVFLKVTCEDNVVELDIQKAGVVRALKRNDDGCSILNIPAREKIVNLNLVKSVMKPL